MDPVHSEASSHPSGFRWMADDAYLFDIDGTLAEHP